MAQHERSFEAAKAVEAVLAEIGKPSFLAPTELASRLGEWLYSAFIMLCWLAVRLSPDGHVVGVHEDLLSAIVAQNMSLMRILASHEDELMNELEFAVEPRIAAALVELIRTYVPTPG